MTEWYQIIPFCSGSAGQWHTWAAIFGGLYRKSTLPYRGAPTARYYSPLLIAPSHETLSSRHLLALALPLPLCGLIHGGLLRIVTERDFIPTTQWCVRHSHSTRPLARPLREANAAAARTHGRGNTPGQHPSRREHATVLVGMLCAHNGTKHQQKHKHTAHSS